MTSTTAFVNGILLTTTPSVLFGMWLAKFFRAVEPKSESYAERRKARKA